MTPSASGPGASTASSHDARTSPWCSSRAGARSPTLVVLGAGPAELDEPNTTVDHLPADDAVDSQLDWSEEQLGVGRLALDRRTAGRVAAALEEAGVLLPARGRHSDAIARNALGRALLWCDTRCPRAEQVDPRLWQVLHHLHEHLAGPLAVPELAAVAGLSASRPAVLQPPDRRHGLSPTAWRERLPRPPRAD